ncbi:hypothetical protein [Streptomyces celluloflavus]|uniref:hypothetical protein n=1 Tax=Streptomyces celluloflavus TaxID=58344 RepID=UPI0036BD8610
MTDGPLLVPAARAAKHYSLDVRTIQRWAAQGRLVRHGTPRRLLVDLKEVDQLYWTLLPKRPKGVV